MPHNFSLYVLPCAPLPFPILRPPQQCPPLFPCFHMIAVTSPAMPSRPHALPSPSHTPQHSTCAALLPAQPPPH
ncbi:hypothetical protein E2C01_027159 [Portunus trituberculatus]|uniref:Uncharacterized protein n=1 Tax=Portunus trituberculatus TaxID=210409 RepID=A0A5B7EKT2_PORTR|nr:hypothetical protein [Portunus trituberculatus]